MLEVFQKLLHTKNVGKQSFKSINQKQGLKLDANAHVDGQKLHVTLVPKKNGCHVSHYKVTGSYVGIVSCERAIRLCIPII